MSYQGLNLKVGILGGTFDPVHHGHLLAAESVRDELKLDEIWFMPSKIPPHKQNHKILSGHHRIRMLELAIQQYPEFKVSKIEFERDQVSYTYDTVQILKERFPGIQFHFIIGADMVEFLPNWHRYKELLTLIQFVAIKRPHYQAHVNHPWMEQIIFVEMPQLELSSSMIRNRCLQGKSIRFLVPDSVLTYIKENRLYVD